MAVQSRAPQVQASALSHSAGSNALAAAHASEPSGMGQGDFQADSGQEKCFRTTHWSAVLAASDQESAQGQEALARLCRTYWLPVYAFVRKRGHSPDQANDLTQDFFATFLEKNSVARAVR